MLFRNTIQGEEIMFFSIIKKRRSIRKFLDKPIETDKLDKIIEAALRSPSSRGFNPWEFIVVTDKATLEQLSRSKPHGSSFLKNAACGIVVLADPKKCDVWIEDASIASIFIHLAAQSLRLGSCWIQIRERMHDNDTSADEYIANILQVPKTLAVESIVAIGYPDEEKPGHPANKLQYEKISFNRYKGSLATDKEEV